MESLHSKIRTIFFFFGNYMIRGGFNFHTCLVHVAWEDKININDKGFQQALGFCLFAGPIKY
jgi:hypothetical protein